MGICILISTILVRTMKKDNRNNQFLQALGQAASLGLNMVAAIIVGLLAGLWLDSRFDSRPWATAIGTILGMLAGLWSAFKKMMQK
jgi:ATP synthase protein I